MTPFIPALKALGPWGWLVIPVVWFMNWRKTPLNPTNPAAPVSPLVPLTPASPANPSNPAAPVEPLLNFLDQIRDSIRNRLPNLRGEAAPEQPQDLDAVALAAKREEIDDQIEKKRAELKTHLNALNR